MAKRRMPRSDFSKVTVPSEHVVPIISDGAIAGPVADGKLLPILILDTTAHPEIDDLMRVQQIDRAPGDVDTVWGVPRTDLDSVFLALHFARPVEVDAVLLFSMERQAVLVESILETQAFYLQPGRPGDRVRHDFEASKIIVEVPDTGFRPHWDRLLLERLALVFSRRGGVGLRVGRQLAHQHIAEMREFTRVRVQP